MKCPKCGYNANKEQCPIPKDCWYTHFVSDISVDPDLNNELRKVPYGKKPLKDFITKPKKKFSWAKTKEIANKVINSPAFEFIINITPKPMKDGLKLVLQWLKNRFKEPSTYKGLSVILSAIGISLSPDLWQAISALGASVIGLIQVIENESKKNKE